MSAKRLTLSDSNEVIFGVCGGLGEYFGIDPVVIRIAWLASVLCLGSGILLYLIFYVAMPEKN